MRPRKQFNYINNSEGLSGYPDKHNNRREQEIENYTRQSFFEFRYFKVNCFPDENKSQNKCLGYATIYLLRYLTLHISNQNSIRTHLKSQGIAPNSIRNMISENPDVTYLPLQKEFKSVGRPYYKEQETALKTMKYEYGRNILVVFGY